MVASDRSQAIDCADSLLRTEGEDIELVGIGLEDMIVVAMPDAVIVVAAGPEPGRARGGGTAEGARPAAGDGVSRATGGPGAGSRRSRAASATRSSGSWSIRVRR